MNLTKAIEILEYRHVRNFSISEAEFIEAERLGIEALKEIQLDRRNRLPFRHTPLPGETKE